MTNQKVLPLGKPSETVVSSASFLVPYHIHNGEISMIVQKNPKHGFHLIGGKREQGESSAQCLERELQEELGQEGYFLANARFCHQEDVSFRCLDLKTKATLYAFRMHIDDMQKFADDWFPDAEYELVVLKARTFSDEDKDTSKVTQLAFSWLNGYLPDTEALIIEENENVG